MEAAWRKAKRALGSSLCVHHPAVAGDREDGASERRASDALSLDTTAAAHASTPNAPAPPEAGALRRSKSGGKSTIVRPISTRPRASLSRRFRL